MNRMNRQRPSPYAVETTPDRLKHRFAVGVDLGQKSDYTAMAVARVIPSPASTPSVNLDRIQVVNLKRWPLRTPYPTIVADVVKALNSPALNAGVFEPGYSARLQRPECLVDATGVGTATVDLALQAACSATIIPVTVTAGHEGREGRWNNTGTVCHYVPKKDLCSATLAVLEAVPPRIEVAASLPDAGILMEEMKNFRVKISAAGNETYGAGPVGLEGHREGKHDDLLLAVAMICWYVSRSRPDPRVVRGSNVFAELGSYWTGRPRRR
jgi:hypothetical protein